MNRFPLIFGHYFKRSLRDPLNVIIFLLLPVGLVTLNMLGLIGMFDQMADGMETAVDNIAANATVLAAVFMVAFQFFSGELLIYNGYELKEGDVRWRLRAAPVPQRTFLAGVSLSSWIFNLAQGILIFSVVVLLFDAHLGNPLIFIAVLLIVSIMSQLLAALIIQLAPRRKTASIVINVFCFAQMFLSGFLFIPLGNSALAEFVTSYGTPLALAHRAILYAGPVLDDMSQAVFNLSILGGITLILIAANLILGRRRSA